MAIETDMLFDWVDLNEIDPFDKPVPRDVYTLKVLGINKKEFQYKKDSKTAKAGDTGQLINLTLAITNHPEYAGRRFNETLFMRRQSLQILRRLMDATGVVQEPGTTLDDWMKTMSEVQPEVKVPVLIVPDTERDGTVKVDPATGKTLDKNVILWKEVLLS